MISEPAISLVNSWIEEANKSQDQAHLCALEQAEQKLIAEDNSWRWERTAAGHNETVIALEQRIASLHAEPAEAKA
jgi:hypothetical protein